MNETQYIIYLLALAYLHSCFLGYGNFVIYRLTVSKRSIFENKNYCEVCKEPFNSVYSYPIIGYVLCLGKCKNCEYKFGAGHLCLELSVFVTTLGVLSLMGLSIISLTLSLAYVALVLVLYRFTLTRALKKSVS